jgi:hypothetical protein
MRRADINLGDFLMHPDQPIPLTPVTESVLELR